MTASTPMLAPEGPPPANAPEPPAGAAWWGMAIAQPFIWLIPGVIFTGIVAGVTGLWIPYTLAAAPVVALFVLFSFQRWWRAQIRERGTRLLSYLENAIRLNLPLLPFL